MNNLLNVSFPLNEAQWKTAARTTFEYHYSYYCFCKHCLIDQLMLYYEQEVDVPDWERDASPAELALEAIEEAKEIHKSINQWYQELLDESEE